MVAPHRQDDGTAGILRQIREMLGTRSRSNVSIPMLPTPKIGFALWWASLILYMTHLVHTKALPPVPKETLYTYYTLDAIRQKLWETDWVTPAIFWTFLFGTFYLLGVWLTKYRLLANAESTDVYNKVMSGELDSVKHKIEAAADPAQLGYYGARLHALVTRWNEDSDLPAVQALKNEILEIDEQNLAHSFVPVMWSESALPLLGFLGTVIGIGQAIGSISEAIKILLKSATSTGGAQLDTLFNKGFENMALAFDTTFFGLFFLLWLGIFHIWEKKAFADRLDNARRFYSLALAQLPQGSTNVMVAGLSELTERVEAVEGTLKVIDEDANAYKSRIEGMVDHVIMEVPQFAPIRKALMKPVVQFAASDAGPAEDLHKSIDKRIGPNWKISAIGLAGGSEAGGIASLSQDHGTKCWVVTFGSELNQNNRILECSTSFMAIHPSTDLESFVGLAHGERGVELCLGVLPTAQATGDTKVDGAVDISTLNQSSLASELMPLSVDGSQVLVATQVGGIVRVALIAIQKSASPKPLLDLSQGVEWKHWDVNRAAGNLVVAGTSATGGSQIDFISLPGTTDLRAGKSGGGKLRQSGPRVIQLPGIPEISQLQAVGSTQCVFSDRKRQLFYMDETRNEPIALKHNDLPASIDRVLSNKNHWLAVVANSRISMWNCRRGGFIYPYDGDALTNTAVNVGAYLVSGDGRHLFNFTDTVILRWSFPKSVGDTK